MKVQKAKKKTLSFEASFNWNKSSNSKSPKNEKKN